MDQNDKPQDQLPLIDIASLSQDEKEALQKRIKEYFVTSNSEPTFMQMVEEFRVSYSTVRKWYNDNNWDDERNRVANLARQRKESIDYLLNPKTSEQALIEGNMDQVLRIQGIHLADLRYAMSSGDFSKLSTILSGIGDLLQKHAATLEKVNSTRIKINNGGVEQKEVRHVHQVTADEALKLALRMNREHNQKITANEAAKLLEQAKKEKSDDGK